MRSLKKSLCLGVALAAVLATQTGLANTPTIRLFPTTVVEDLKQTGNVARDMETGLQEVISRLDQQQVLYNESKCDGADGDPGCQRLARQIGATYLEMLTIMEERLPDMEHTVNNTRQSLEKGLRTELGKKMTPWTLQETLVGTGASQPAAKSSPTLRGRSGMRLSERFKQYYELVATSGAQRRPVACGAGVGHLPRHGGDQFVDSAHSSGNRPCDAHGTAESVIRHHHTRDDRSRRRGKVDPVWRCRSRSARCGTTAGKRRAGLPQPP